MPSRDGHAVLAADASADIQTAPSGSGFKSENRSVTVGMPGKAWLIS